MKGGSGPILRRPGRRRGALALLWCGACAVALADLGEGPWLPGRLGVWRVEAEAILPRGQRLAEQGPVWTLGDLNADGQPDLVEVFDRSLLAYDHADGLHRILFEQELPAGWVPTSHAPWIGPIHDFDGDGRAEVVVPLQTTDHAQWRLLITNPLDDRPLLDTPLPVGEDRRREPYWDGFYTGLDTMTVADGRLALLLFCSVLYDGLGRGLLAVDPLSGEVIWRHALGPQPVPIEGIHAVVSWPGRPGSVVAFGTGSPANLGGLTVDGFSDDQARLFVIDDAGACLWTARLDSFFAVTRLRAVDLGGDDGLRLVTTTDNRNHTDPARLTVWDPQTRTPSYRDEHPQAFDAIVPIAAGRIATLAGNRELREYRHRGDGRWTWRTVRRFQHDASISREFRGGPAGRRDDTWYVVSLRDGSVRLHDARHRVLGRFGAPLVANTAHRVDHWRTGDHDRLVYSQGNALMVLALHDRTASWTAVLASAWLLAAGGVLGILVAGGRRRRDLEALRRILARRLGEVAHRDFRMVRDILEYPAFLRDAEAMRLDGYRRHVQELGRDLVEATVPHLHQTLVELDLAGYAPPDLVRARRDLQAVKALLAGESATATLTDPASEASRRYDRLSAELYAAFARIYEDLHGLVCTDGVAVIQATLTRRAGELQAAGVDLQAALPAAGHDTAVLADAAQLGFIVDGLVANALRAMADGGVDRRLDVRWQARRNGVDLLVRDGGVGIDPDAHERIFSAAVASEGGSGFGLRRSRELLRPWGGDLEVAASSPGHGTTMRLSLRVFQRPRRSREATP